VSADERRLRVLVLEDEWVARAFLVELIEATGLAEVVAAVASVDEANELLGPGAPAFGVDVAFVDVNLAGAGESGLALVRSYRGRSEGPVFVLATAVRDHALDAFDLGVVDYLLKPFTSERVRECLTRLRARVAPRAVELPRRVVARRKKALVFLSIDDIWAFESADRLCFVHARPGVFDMDLSLASIELSFGGSFTRVHRNWLVNQLHVRELDRDAGECTLLVGEGYDESAGGVRVPVSRDRVQVVRDGLIASAPGLRRR
jgi:DNA-binding LytR/AlgR family response regulator